jgi:hypothetical protein
MWLTLDGKSVEKKINAAKTFAENIGNSRNFILDAVFCHTVNEYPISYDEGIISAKKEVLQAICTPNSDDQDTACKNIIERIFRGIESTLTSINVDKMTSLSPEDPMVKTTIDDMEFFNTVAIHTKINQPIVNAALNLIDAPKNIHVSLVATRDDPAVPVAYTITSAIVQYMSIDGNTVQRCFVRELPWTLPYNSLEIENVMCGIPGKITINRGDMTQYAWFDSSIMNSPWKVKKSAVDQNLIELNRAYDLLGADVDITLDIVMPRFLIDELRLSNIWERIGPGLNQSIIQLGLANRFSQFMTRFRPGNLATIFMHLGLSIIQDSLKCSVEDKLTGKIFWCPFDTIEVDGLMYMMVQDMSGEFFSIEFAKNEHDVLIPGQYMDCLTAYSIDAAGEYNSKVQRVYFKNRSLNQLVVETTSGSVNYIFLGRPKTNKNIYHVYLVEHRTLCMCMPTKNQNVEFLIVKSLPNIGLSIMPKSPRERKYILDNDARTHCGKLLRQVKSTAGARRAILRLYSSYVLMQSIQNKYEDILKNSSFRDLILHACISPSIDKLLKKAQRIASLANGEIGSDLSKLTNPSEGGLFDPSHSEVRVALITATNNAKNRANACRSLANMLKTAASALSAATGVHMREKTEEALRVLQNADAAAQQAQIDCRQAANIADTVAGLFLDVDVTASAQKASAAATDVDNVAVELNSAVLEANNAAVPVDSADVVTQANNAGRQLQNAATLCDPARNGAYPIDVGTVINATVDAAGLVQPQVNATRTAVDDFKNNAHNFTTLLQLINAAGNATNQANEHINDCVTSINTAYATKLPAIRLAAQILLQQITRAKNFVAVCSDTIKNYVTEANQAVPVSQSTANIVYRRALEIAIYTKYICRCTILIYAATGNAPRGAAGLRDNLTAGETADIDPKILNVDNSTVPLDNASEQIADQLKINIVADNNLILPIRDYAVSAATVGENTIRTHIALLRTNKEFQEIGTALAVMNRANGIRDAGARILDLAGAARTIWDPIDAITHAVVRAAFLITPAVIPNLPVNIDNIKTNVKNIIDSAYSIASEATKIASAAESAVTVATKKTDDIRIIINPTLPKNVRDSGAISAAAVGVNAATGLVPAVKAARKAADQANILLKNVKDIAEAFPVGITSILVPDPIPPLANNINTQKVAVEADVNNAVRAADAADASAAPTQLTELKAAIAKAAMAATKTAEAADKNISATQNTNDNATKAFKEKPSAASAVPMVSNQPRDDSDENDQLNAVMITRFMIHLQRNNSMDILKDLVGIDKMPANVTSLRNLRTSYQQFLNYIAGKSSEFVEQLETNVESIRSLVDGMAFDASQKQDLSDPKTAAEYQRFLSIRQRQLKSILDKMKQNFDFVKQQQITAQPMFDISHGEGQPDTQYRIDVQKILRNKELATKLLVQARTISRMMRDDELEDDERLIKTGEQKTCPKQSILQTGDIILRLNATFMDEIEAQMPKYIKQLRRVSDECDIRTKGILKNIDGIKDRMDKLLSAANSNIQEAQKDRDRQRRFIEYKLRKTKGFINEIIGQFKSFEDYHIGFIMRKFRGPIRLISKYKGPHKDEVQKAINLISQKVDTFYSQFNRKFQGLFSTNALIRDHMEDFDVRIVDDWITKSQEKYEVMAEKIMKMYKNEFSLLEMLLDTQFMLLYFIKLIRFGFLWLSLFLAGSVFINKYTDLVYNQHKDPPPMSLLVIMFIAIEFGLNVILWVILMFVKSIYKREENNFVIDSSLVKRVITDYAVSTLLIGMTSYAISEVIRKRIVFNYANDGTKPIAAFKNIVLIVSGFTLLVPFFLIAD